METVRDFIFLGSKITEDDDCSHEIKRCLLLGRKAMTNLDSILKSRDIALPTKVHLVKAMVFPVIMYGYNLDYKESWAPKNWCFLTVVLEKTLESPLDCKEIKPFNPKEISPEYSWKNWCWSWNSNTLTTWCEELTHWKRPWSCEILKAEGEGTTEIEMVGWYHRFDGHEFEQALGVGEGQRSLVCYSPWGHKELDTTEQLNWTEFIRLVSGDILWPPFWCLFQNISLSSFTVTKALSNQAWSLILKLNFLLWRSQIWHHSL